MTSIVELKAVETIAHIVLSKAQQATLLTLSPGPGNSATWRVLRRLQLIYNHAPLLVSPTPLGEAVRAEIAKEVWFQPGHWIRKEPYWPRIKHTVEELAQ